jgi:putative ABC transport system permease protein
MFRFLLRSLPLAWAQLSHQKVRLTVALVGVCFANILMFTQLGLLAVLFDGVTQVHEQLQGDLFITSSFSRFLGRQGFPKTYLYQADAIPGVTSASPLYISNSDWVDAEQFLSPDRQLPGAADRQKASAGNIFPVSVRVLAFNLERPVLNIPEINAQLDRLSEPDSILFDRLSQPSLGPVVPIFERDRQVKTIMGNKRIYVTGLFNLGSTLFDEGNVVMSDWNYARRNGSKQLDNISVGVLQLEPGVSLNIIQERLRQTLPKSLSVLTKPELVALEQESRSQDPSGKVLGFGAVMGFIVGIIVVYQVLYTDVSDHLPEYATLKAMGYSGNRLMEVVLFEAVLLAILGFIPGVLSSVGVYQLLAWTTKIPVTMRFGVASQVFGLTIAMCVFSGAVAMRKLGQADPADIF